MPSKFSAVLEPELIVTLSNIGNICSHYFPQFFCSRLYSHFDYTRISIDVKLNHKASFFQGDVFSEEHQYNNIFKRASRDWGIKPPLTLNTLLKIRVKFLVNFSDVRNFTLILCLCIPFISLERPEQTVQCSGTCFNSGKVVFWGSSCLWIKKNTCRGWFRAAP